MIKRCPSRELAPAITFELEIKSVHPLGNGSPGKSDGRWRGKNGPDRLGTGGSGTRPGPRLSIGKVKCRIP